MRLSSQNPGDLKALIQRQEEELIHLREEVEFLKEGKKLVIWKHREAAARIEQLEAALRDDPTPEQIYNACLSYRHDFGLLPVEDRKAVVFDAKEWLRAWQKTLKRAALEEKT